MGVYPGSEKRHQCLKGGMSIALQGGLTANERKKGKKRKKRNARARGRKGAEIVEHSGRGSAGDKGLPCADTAEDRSEGGCTGPLR